ncbi:bifunctional diguanylate cyclase/phosphodiesterase [Variovorax atrisoli]|uniref:bifunctional diguanylate cyclase/phosphodiesterase n=1 Tax=Variovorax atrisoli TaxID=3394203 RepID=UPI0016187209|nr:EAL domain-containing protein [Variovorax sp. BK613]MBB3641566.1 diguanylate cyclase (GGDEF)-like protein [Variovorax sp. BK613]
MTPRFPRRITAVIYGVALSLLATAGTVAAVIVWEARQKAIVDHENQTIRFVAGSEAALNRALLSVDMLLAGANEILRGSTAASAASEASSPGPHQLLENLVRQNLLVRHIAFVDARGTVVASSDRRGDSLPLALPAGFVDSVLAKPVSTLAISVPAVSMVTSQKVLYLARAVTLADGSRMLSVAEVQLSLLATIMTQGAGLRGLEVTLEHDAGPLLASLPPRDDLGGRPIEPAMHEQTSDGKPKRMAARLSGEPAIVVARPTLHRNLLIVASLPLSAALQDWRRERDLVAWTGALIALMSVAVARFAHVQLRRQWHSRMELVRSKATLDQALESMAEGFILLDAEHRVLNWNHSFVAMFPWTASMIAPQLPFQRIMDETAKHVVHGRGPAGWSALNAPQLAQAHSEQEALLQNGQVIRATRSRTPDGGLVCVYHDITEKRRHTAAIIESKAQLQATLDALPDLLLEVGLDGRCHGHHAPRVPFHVAGFESPVGRTLQELLPSDAASQVMAALREAHASGYSAGRQFERRDKGERTWFEISASRKAVDEAVDETVHGPIDDDASRTDAPGARFIVILRDITQSKRAAREIEHLAFYDTLTGLPNRRRLLDRLHQTLGSAAQRPGLCALLFLDLDNFKTLNDALGHDVGDVLLQQVAQRLKSCLRDGDTVARLGGDEFVVILDDLDDEIAVAVSQTETVGAAILAHLNQPYTLGTQHHHSTCSIGASLFDARTASIEEVLKQADIAMYRAKTDGGNALRFFESDMQTRITARAALENELHAAIAAQQFVLHYQSQVTSENRVVGAEVLVRWHHPVRGLLLPGQFIDVAEDTGLIIPMGLWVLETACRQLTAWQGDPRRRHLKLSVNVSARQFREGDFVDQVSRVLTRTGADPGKLELELTESLLHEKVADAIGKMEALAALGIQFSMDDFGTGFSSLSYMTQLPLSQVKIDKFFVHRIGLDPKVESIIQAIIGMARSMELELVAEGVETPAQREFLLRHGCELCQGYLFGVPQPLEIYERELDGELPASNLAFVPQ